jgi:hypothetical protein
MNTKKIMNPRSRWVSFTMCVCVSALMKNPETICVCVSALMKNPETKKHKWGRGGFYGWEDSVATLTIGTAENCSLMNSKRSLYYCMRKVLYETPFI